MGTSNGETKDYHYLHQVVCHRIVTNLDQGHVCLLIAVDIDHDIRLTVVVSSD